ncbi:MAG: aminotransferase class V-fold PLP-dependent enzyme [Candidatus Hodarchaeota archaeon]
MKIARTIPPTASPIYLSDIFHGIIGLINEDYYLETFRKELCDYFDVKYCFLLSSGKAALTLILTALKESFPGKNEVLIPAYTCYSVPSSIIKAGLKVTLCDINPETLEFDYNQLTKKITKRTLCIIVCHLFGYIGDLDRLKRLAKDKGVFLIEDDAQAMGAEYKGQKVGSLADVGFFSLGRGKNISVVEGGIILTNNETIAVKLKNNWDVLNNYSSLEKISLILKALLLNLLLRPYLYWFPYCLPFLNLGATIFSTNFKIKKMSGFQCGLARNWRQKLKNFNKIRENNANFYLTCIDPDKIRKIEAQENTKCVYLRFPIKLKNGLKKDFFRNGKRNSLGIGPAYPGSIDSISQITPYLQKDKYPEANKIAQSLLTLPTHSLVTGLDKDKIINLLNCKNIQ